MGRGRGGASGGLRALFEYELVWADGRLLVVLRRAQLLESELFLRCRTFMSTCNRARTTQLQGDFGITLP